jgi:adenylosuccinate synthase
VIDTSAYVNEAMKQGKKILLEGAQGLLLSILYGTTQYQTSSDCSVEGLAQGAGIKPSDIDLVIGLAKAPYMTRVGNGPLPTEIDRNNRSSASEREEAEMMPDPLMYLNSSDPVALTRAIRRIGGEYGATTGRPRRIGWLDVLEIDHSCKINGGVLALTKLDVMTGREYLQVCTGYVYRGSDVFYAGKIIRNGDAINKFIRDSDILKHCEPVYHEMPGWDTPLSEITEYEDLPAQVKDLVRFIEDSVGCQVAIISVGPDREQVIFRQLKSDLPPALFAVFAG